jgi:hypothetical protein
VACLNQSAQRGYSGVFPANRNVGRNVSGHEPNPVEVSPEAERKKKEANEAWLERFRRANGIRLGLIPAPGESVKREVLPAGKNFPSENAFSAKPE